MYEDLKGKKLLIFGGIGYMADLITLAHRHCVSVGVADYNKDTHVKRLADYVHDVNILDVDAVVKLYRENRYDGIITNFNDMLMPYACEVAKQVGACVPYTQEQIRMSTDKAFFKQTCIKYGVPVPKKFDINSVDDIEKSGEIYPVIIKPVDGSGSKGISICKNQVELVEGFIKAQRTSKCKKVIVEQYIDYDDEVNLTYIVQNGNPQLAAVHDRYFNQSQKDLMRVPDMYIYPSKYTNIILEKYNDSIINMLRGIGLQNGSLFLQGCFMKGKLYIYEAGMRLNGCKTYQILEYENKYNTFEELLYFALTNKFRECQLSPKFKKWYATWNVVAKPGVVIDKIAGNDEIISYPWLIHNGMVYFEGDTIPENAGGTLIQLQSRIHLYGDTKEELLEHLQIVYDLYHLYDSDGNELILSPHSIVDLDKHLNYSLFR